MAYALVNTVELQDSGTGRTSARDDVAPRASAIPGLQYGVWLAQKGSSAGLSVLIFDTEEQADGLADGLRSGQVPRPEGVRFLAHEVYEVVAEARPPVKPR